HNKLRDNVGWVATTPSLVPRRDVEEISGFDLDDAAVRHGRDCFPRDNQADMLDRALLQPGRCADIDRPLPARVISRATDRHTADTDQLEFSFGERACFVRLVETLQDDIEDT